MTGHMQAGSKFQQVQSAIAKAGLEALAIENQGSSIGIQKPPASAAKAFTETKQLRLNKLETLDTQVGDGLVPMIGGLQSQLSLKFGKTIHNSGYKEVPNSAIQDVAKLLSTMPEVKGKKKKKKAAAEEPGPTETPAPDEDGGGKKKKKKKGKKEKPSDVPEWPPLMIGPPMTAE